MKKTLMLVTLSIAFTMSIYSQNSDFKFNKTSSFGIGYGATRGNNGTFSADFTGSSNSFAWSFDLLAMSPENDIDGNYIRSNLGFKIGALSAIKDRSYFSFLFGLSRVRGYYIEEKIVYTNWFPKVEEEEITFTKIGVPLETNLVFSIAEGLGLGIKGFVNANGQSVFYGGMACLRITDFR